ncbi:uncharacterized protein VP01_1822g1 [Puccinia sorghi]|uniref:Uncharacterized protein n=1 Tax=Puccinia sorghi TaxID=27349 RepID=A0A0L6VEK1_9BASI|nr:uncharacterized protein VP01_1822g1 [Puccinia sorghi]
MKRKAFAATSAIVNIVVLLCQLFLPLLYLGIYTPRTSMILSSIQKLTMLRLYCNHPRLVDAIQFNLPNNSTTWKDSPKVFHLVTDLKKHLETEQPTSKGRYFFPVEVILASVSGV